MEIWQKDYITKHLPQLLRITILRSGFLTRLASQDVLSDEEVQVLVSEVKQYDRSREFYTLIMGKINGYARLMEILFTEKQSGAHGIILDGASQHAIPKLKLQIHRTIQSLVDILPDEVLLLELQEILKKQTSCIYECLHAQKDGNAIHLVKDAPTVPVYARRKSTFKKCNEVDPRMFKEECEDVFVFTKETSVSELKCIAAPNSIFKSSDVLLQIVAPKFILLDVKEHWRKICEKSNSTVYLINIENEDKYIIEETCGETHLAQKFLNRKQKKAVTEERFISDHRQNIKHPIILISDEEELRNWNLLVNIAEKITNDYSKCVTAYITLKEFIASFSISSSVNADNLESTLSDTVKCISPTLLTKTILQKLVENGILHILLCLTAFEEVNEDEKKLMQIIFINLEHFKNINVYIIAGSKLRNDLETIFGVISFDVYYEAKNELKKSRQMRRSIDKPINTHETNIRCDDLQRNDAKCFTKELLSEYFVQVNSKLEEISEGMRQINRKYDQMAKDIEALKINQQACIKKTQGIIHKNIKPNVSTLWTEKSNQ